MKERDMTKQQLVAELTALRRKAESLEAALAHPAERRPGPQEIETKYREVGSSIPGAVFQFRLSQDGTRSFPFVSEGIHDLMGLSRQEMEAYPEQVFGRILPGDADLVNKAIQEAAMTLETSTVEFRVKTYKGDIRWLRSTSSPHREPDGSIVWNGILVDISEQKEAVEALGKAEERYRTIFDSVGDAILILGSEGHFIDANRAACEHLGYTREQLQAMHPRDIVPPEFAPFVPDIIKEIAERGHAVFETAHVTSNGKVVPVEGSGHVANYGGTNAEIVVFRDVSARKRAEEELLRLRKAVDTSGEVVFLTDRTGTISYINPEFTRVYGYEASEVVGKTTPRVIKSGLLPSDSYQAFWETLLKNQVVRGELVNRTKDGRLVDIESSANPIVGEHGEIIGFLAIQRDISVRKKAEKELLASQERLERVHRLSQALSSSLDMETVTRLALDEVARTFGRVRTTTGIALLDDWGQLLTVVAARGVDEKAAAGASFSLSSFHPDVVDRVFKLHEPWVYKDINDAPEVLKIRPGFMEQSNLILVPLLARDHAIGYLFLGSGDSAPFAPGEIVLLETYASEMALAIQNARLYARTDAALTRRIADLEALTAVLGAATTSLDLDSIMTEVLKRSARALNTERIVLLSVDADRSNGTVRYCYSSDETASENRAEFRFADSLALDDSTAGLSAVKIQDVRSLAEGDAKTKLLESGIKSALLVPLAIGGRAIGTLYFACTSGPRQFAAEEVSLASAIGSYLASVVENARLHENVARERSTLESIIASMNEGLVVIDSRGIVVYCNHAARELLGFDASVCVGQSIGNVMQDLSPSTLFS